MQRPLVSGAGWTYTAAPNSYFGTFACTGKGSGYVNAPPQNDKAVSKYTATVTGQVTSVIFTYPHNISAGFIKAVIYDDTGPGGTPGNLLGVGTVSNFVSDGGEVTSTFAGVPVVNGLDYWFGVVSAQNNSFTNNCFCPPQANGIAYNNGPYSAPSNPFGSASLANFRYPLIVMVTETPVAPTVTKVSPIAGPETGGTVATITGTSFTGATAVVFGSVPAVSFSVDTDTQITATTDVGAVGTVDVRVTNLVGTSPVNAPADQFSFYSTSAPVVDGINPTSGPTTGGTAVTITGSGFTGALAVNFGASSSPEFTVVSDTEIDATSPPHIAETVDVIVFTPAGRSPATSADLFTFVPPPPPPPPEPPCSDTTCIDDRSGTWCWNPAAMTIISQALRRCGVINDEESPTQAMYDATLMTLNGITKELETSGIHVWTEEEAILFLQQGQNRYLLGGCEDDAAHCCDAYAYLLQTLAAPALQNATTIQLTDATGFIDGFHVGLFLDNGETFWTKQVGAPSGNIITIADAVPSNIPQGNWVFGYETNITRPLKVPRARLHYFQGSRDTPIQTISRQEYQDLPNKENPGLVTQFFYAPKLRQGELYAWQNPFMYGLNNATALRIKWYRPIQNWDDLTNTADFPQEWINPLSWILAEEIGPEYDVPADRWGIISAKATKARERAEDWDRESEDVSFGFNWDSPYQGRR